MKNRLFNFFILFVSAAFLFTACDNNGTSSDGEQNIVEVASSSDDFDVLAQAITDAGLASALEAEGSFTVFAPTDEAFGKLPTGLLEELTNEQLASILRFHVISGNAITSGQLQATQDVGTLLGEEILVENSGSVIVNGYSTVVNANIEASNGVIHAIDEVLLPEGFRDANVIDKAKELQSFTSLVSAVADVDLTTTLKYKGDFTVFAPTDDAFNALPTGLLGSLTNEQLAEILSYHVLSGEVFAGDLSAEQAPASLTGESIFVTKDGQDNVIVNGSASVATADVDVSNGVIHAIDKVILPDAYGTVVDAASKRYVFETLVEKVVEANLAGALSNSEATLTVFAPTDEAFGKLPAGLLDQLTTQQLAEILSYHVLPVQVASGELVASQSVGSLTEENVFVTVDNGTVSVNGNATVIAPDVTTNNGIVHGIDEVILPNKFLNIVGIASKNYDLSTLVTLLGDNNLVTTLEGDGPFTVFAPTNQAFDDAQSLIDTLTPEQVSDVLKYHVAGLKALSGNLFDGQTVPTVQGEDITINVDSENNVTLNGSINVTTVDLEGTNGVIHIIDSVLVPPSFQN